MSVCNITVPVFGKAVSLLERHGLRTLDALHLACAIVWQADLFVSSDQRQVAAALKSGLRVIQV
jgi:uncharacterized protein